MLNLQVSSNNARVISRGYQARPEIRLPFLRNTRHSPDSYCKQPANLFRITPVPENSLNTHYGRSSLKNFIPSTSRCPVYGLPYPRTGYSARTKVLPIQSLQLLLPHRLTQRHCSGKGKWIQTHTLGRRVRAYRLDIAVDLQVGGSEIYEFIRRVQ